MMYTLTTRAGPAIARLLAIALILALLAPFARGQETASADADRPGTAETSEVLASGAWQIEGGYAAINAGGVHVDAFGQGLLRVGLPAAAELQLHANSYDVLSSPAGHTSGYEQLAAGVKLHLLDGAPLTLRPAVALSASTTLPTGSGIFGGRGYDPTVTAIAAWRPMPRVGLTANVAYASLTEPGARMAQWTDVAGADYTVTPALRLFGEYYEIRNEDRTRGTDAGLAWTATHDVQLRASAGRETSPGAPVTYVRVGVVRRW